MDSCDVLIAGGGPAGSSCAWFLRGSGLDVRILDRRTFPRDKICGGWITPEVLQALAIDPADYARGRVLQPIRGFRTSRLGGRVVETRYETIVSYGIRRFEFDHFLLARCGAPASCGEELRSLERDDGGWRVNGRLRARFVVGAGGHFCPVARRLGTVPRGEPVVAAQELEVALDARDLESCAVRGEMPELYFCPDLKGYGWCFRKGDWLNVGLGRLDGRRLGGHVAAFVAALKRAGRIPRDYPEQLAGHAYLLHGWSRRPVVAAGALLVGDAAGLAYPQSGEGIRPAVESGLLAGQALVEALRGDTGALERYRERLAARFGPAVPGGPARLGRHLPARLVEGAGRVLLGQPWFARRWVLDRWFLHRGTPAL